MNISGINKLLGIKLPLTEKDLPKYFERYATKFWFNKYKIEKDFLLTIFLMDFSKSYPQLIFKWWTCLNKLYYDYYRLSEDLDFFIISEAWQDARWNIFSKLKSSFQDDKYKKIWLEYTDPEYWTTHKKNSQWWYLFRYNSVFDWSEQWIQIDIRIEKESLFEPIEKEIGSIYLDDILEEPLFNKTHIKAMDLREIASEKVRAALTRQPDPAIRDFFDIQYMITNWVNFDDLKEQIARKIIDYRDNWNTEDKLYTDISIDKLAMDIESDLIPVLCTLKDKTIKFDKSNLEEICKFIEKFKV